MCEPAWMNSFAINPNLSGCQIWDCACTLKSKENGGGEVDGVLDTKFTH